MEANAGGDCVGAKEPLPGVVVVACPLDVAVGYGCEVTGGVFCHVDCTGVEAPPPLLIESDGVLCPPLEECANDEPDWVIPGGGVEVFTIGSALAEGVAVGD